MRRTRDALVRGLAAVVLVANLAGCSAGAPVTFEPAGAPRTGADVEAAARTADLSGVARIDVDGAVDRRREVLVWLRGQGPEGQRAASLLTLGFPERTPAVPIYVAVADVDGVRSLVVVEAAGDSNGVLQRRRLWVFDLKNGKLLDSASYL